MGNQILLRLILVFLSHGSGFAKLVLPGGIPWSSLTLRSFASMISDSSGKMFLCFCFIFTSVCWLFCFNYFKVLENSFWVSEKFSFILMLTSHSHYWVVEVFHREPWNNSGKVGIFVDYRMLVHKISPTLSPKLYWFDAKEIDIVLCHFFQTSYSEIRPTQVKDKTHTSIIQLNSREFFLSHTRLSKTATSTYLVIK